MKRKSTGARHSDRKANGSTETSLLTLREREVLEQVAAGKSNKEVAAAMGISANTVAVHVRSAYRKLKVHSRKELAARAETAQATPVPHLKTLSRQYIMALDQRTNCSRAVVFDPSGKKVSSAERQLVSTYPHDGWVEQDGMVLWSTQAGVASEALTRAGLSSQDLAGIGIANQRETILVWDRESGRPVYPAILWQDRRTTAMCEKLRRDGMTDWIRSRTGLLPDAYFSATKLQWILNNVKGVRRLAASGQLLCGTVDSWLVWNATGGKVHVTDASNASLTMLYNIHNGTWDDELLEYFGIPEAMLPEIRSSSEVYGNVRVSFAAGVPIASMVGDQNAALFCQRCLSPRMVMGTYGAGCFLMMNTGKKIIKSKRGLLSTVAWDIGGRKHYALEGPIFVAGDALQWMCDGVGVARRPLEVEALARTVPDTGGAYLVPAFHGLAAPHWTPQARGIAVGLTERTMAAHLARASIESIAYQTRDILKAMESDARVKVSELRVGGPLTASDLLMQFQADILRVPVRRSQEDETTAAGAAYLAGLALGYWADQDAISRQWKEDSSYQAALSKPEVRALVAGWDRAIRTAVAWAD